jgi:hypothetical protein
MIEFLLDAILTVGEESYEVAVYGDPYCCPAYGLCRLLTETGKSWLVIYYNGTDVAWPPEIRLV